MLQTIALFALTLAQAPVPPQPDSAALDGTWMVEVIDNITVMPEAPVTLTFRGPRVSGMASCNSFQGNYTIEGQQLTFASLLATMKACDSPRMSQERDFLALLRQVARYELGRKDTLTLVTTEGKRMSLRKK